jgi:TetR/AcrR family transcriptional regulator, lmrAB and yxaGH operons repressor
MTSTPTRLIHSMRQALATHGYHGIGLSELLKNAQAPKGVLYHHFPGGKRDLAIATLRFEADRIRHFFQEKAETETPFIQKIGIWFDSAYLHLEKSEFQLGCPLAGVAHNIQEADTALREALSSVFSDIRFQLAEQLMGAGLETTQAKTWADLILSTFEGGLLLARTARSGAPLRASTNLLLALLKDVIDQAQQKP